MVERASACGPSWSAERSLTSLFASNNQGAAGGGIYFNVINLGPTDAEVLSWDLNLAPAGADLVQVYWRAGTFAGAETSIAGWAFVGSGLASDPANPIDTPKHLAVGGPVIPAFATIGIAMICTTSAWRYTNAVLAASDGVLSLAGGTANNVAFSSPAFSPRAWNGTVYYRVGTTERAAVC